ncbi:ABC transporter substrate-binding protein [Paenibacillus puerhi]|uniref:ABC transporter substrate-binding protein n=1 Tax=Paenibacillus puerhi TaxID=2692622 RepID=UPI0013593EE0|nr:ABC transporter substrate-binding protein [Paenibacillus puerhi]
MWRLSIVLVGLVLVTTSCLQHNDSETDQVNAQEEKVTLTILTNIDWMADGVYQQLFHEYQKKSGNHIQVQVVPGGQRFEEIVTAKIATQDYPDLLLYIPTKSYIEQLQPQKNFVDLSNEPYVTYINPEVRKLYGNLRGKTYGIPMSGIFVNGVFYNKDVFRKADITDIPETWEAFIEACERIKSIGVTPIYESGGDKWPLIQFSLMGFSSNLKDKPEIIDQLHAGELTFSGLEPFRELLYKQLELKDKGYVNKNLFSGTYSESLSLLASGKVGMIFQSDFIIPQLKRNNPEAEIGIFPFPNGENRVVTYSFPYELFILNQTQHLTQAKEFVSFLTQAETLGQYYMLRRMVPAWSSIETDLDPILTEVGPYIHDGLTQFGLSELTDTTLWTGDFPSLLIDMLAEEKTPEDVLQALDMLFEQGRRL